MKHTPSTVGIVDYGTGNIASLDQAFEAIGARVKLVSSPQHLSGIDAMVLPGVGHFGPASLSLISSGLGSALIDLIHKGIPTLGICLGLQLLTASSQEDDAYPGLGLLPLHAERIRPANTRLYKVPHLGWNTIVPGSVPPQLLSGIAPHQLLFYFANGYAVAPAPDFTTPHAVYEHGRPWLALVEQDNIMGVQFHPEKSRSQGLQLFRNFLAT